DGETGSCEHRWRQGARSARPAAPSHGRAARKDRPMTRPVPRRRLRPRAALVGGLALAAAALAAPAHAAPSVTAVTLGTPASVEVGAEVTVTVAATGAVDLYAYDVAVAYDPALVALVDDSVVTPDGGFADVTDD